MEYKIDKLEKNYLKITIDINSSDFGILLNEAYEKNKSKFVLPGFRKGKVPRSVLEQRNGKDFFYDAAINIGCNKYYNEILLKEKKLNIMTDPKVEITKIDNTGVTLELSVISRPDVELAEYKNLKFKKNKYEITEQDIENEIKYDQSVHASSVEITTRKTKMNDMVIIDFDGYIEGKKIDAACGKNISLILGSKSFIPGFEEQLVDFGIGEDRTIKVVFPQNYYSDDVKGKEATFEVHLNKIKEIKMPELTDEFVHDTFNVNNVEEYKQQIKQRLEEKNKNKEENELEENIISTIVQNSKVFINDELIDKQVDNMIKYAEQEFALKGLKFVTYLESIHKTLDDYKKEIRNQAENIVKKQIVMWKLMEIEKIDATEEDIENKYLEMSKKHNKSVEELKKSINVNNTFLSAMRNEIIIDKLFNMLKNVNIIE